MHDDKDKPTAASVITRRTFLRGSGAAAASTVAVTSATTGFAQEGTPSPVASPEAMAHTGATDDRRPVEFFTPHEAATVEALTARILPGTPEDPGAREAGAVFYIDSALAGANSGYSLKTYTQGPFPFVEEETTAVEISSALDNYRAVPISSDTISRYGYQSVLTPQDIYRRGLAFLDVHCQAEHGANFVDLAEAEQDEVIAAMADDSVTGFEGPTGRAFFAQLRNDTITGVFSDPMYGGNRDLAGWKLIGYPGAQRFYTPDDIVNTSFSREPQSLAQLMANEGH